MELAIGPLRIYRRACTPGRIAAVTGCSKYALNHSCAPAASPGNANVRGVRSPATDSVTESLTSGA